MLLSKIQGTQALIHYIEGFIDQLVEDKTLKLVDVGSSPMVGLHHMMVFSMKYIYKVPAQYYLAEPALGGYTWLFKVYMIISTKSLLIIA